MRHDTSIALGDMFCWNRMFIVFLKERDGFLHRFGGWFFFPSYNQEDRGKRCVCVDQEASDGGGDGEGSEGVHEEKSGEPSMKRERERERER
jgi:hypothetical protein